MTNGINEGDFTNYILKDLGVDVEITPYTKTIEFSGDEILTIGTPFIIKAVFMRRHNKYEGIKQGIRQDTDGYIMLDPTVLVEKNYEVKKVGEDEIFRVVDSIKRSSPAQIDLFRFCNINLL